jgi:hypothetical protein
LSGGNRESCGMRWIHGFIVLNHGGIEILNHCLDGSNDSMTQCLNPVVPGYRGRQGALIAPSCAGVLQAAICANG